MKTETKIINKTLAVAIPKEIEIKKVDLFYRGVMYKFDLPE